MNVAAAQHIINRAYNAPASILSGDEWESLENLYNAIDGNPPAQAMPHDDAEFLQGVYARSVGQEDDDL